MADLEEGPGGGGVMGGGSVLFLIVPLRRTLNRTTT